MADLSFMILWAVSAALIALSMLVVATQFSIIAENGRRTRENRRNRSYVSFIPLIGGAMGALGCLLAPSSTIRLMWWIPPLIDPGCVLMLSGAAFTFFKK